MKPTREELQRELLEKQRDVEDFLQAYNLVNQRLRESRDRNCTVLPLHEWAGATGLVDIMQVILTPMEKVVEELQRQLLFDDIQTPPTQERPTLKLVTGASDEPVQG